MNNVFTLEVFQRRNDPFSLLRVDDVDRIAISDIIIKMKKLNDVGWDAGV